MRVLHGVTHRGPNPEVDALDTQRLKLIVEYKPEFPMKDLDDALVQRRIERREEEQRPERERRAREAEDRRLRQIQWDKVQEAEKKNPFTKRI